MIKHGDCLDVMKSFDDNYVDSIVTDPPYGLRFMGKKWDYDIPSIDIWRECLRILKPGGHLLSFAGSRTQHRMTVNIEDAGFEIRDCIMWIYGSGFPKSLDISKAIDKLKGEERDVIGINQNYTKMQISPSNYNLQRNLDITKPSSPEAIKWDGWGSNLKPAYEPILICRKPISEKTIAENVLKWGVGGINIDECRVESNQNEYDIRHYTDEDCFQNKTPKKSKFQVKPQPSGRWPANIIIDGSDEVMELFPYTKSPWGKDKSKSKTKSVIHSSEERYVDNGLYQDSGSAARFFKKIEDNVCFLCCNVYDTHNKKGELCTFVNVNNAEKNSMITKAIKENIVQENAIVNLNKKAVLLAKYVGNLCDSCAISIVQEVAKAKNLDSKKLELLVIQDFIGNYKKCILIQNLVKYAETMDNIDTTQITQDLLKLFGCVHLAIKNYIQKTKKLEPNRFVYQAKATKKERGESNNHPTVKPLKLIEYLVKLVTPQNGVVLDCFAGSGTTGVAARNLNRDFILIEKEKEYVELIKERLAKPTQLLINDN